MTLKNKVKSIEEVDEKYRDLYKKESDGSFVLDVDGVEDVTGLKNALSSERQAAEDARRKAREAADELARAKGDIPALEESWKSKVSEARKEGTKRIEQLTRSLEKATVEHAARELATKLAPSATALLLPHIRPRLAMEVGADDTPIVRILDQAGKPSAASLTDLENEFKANKDFAAVITGSRASGGGTPSQSQGGGSASGAPNLNKMSASELAAYMRTKRGG